MITIFLTALLGFTSFLNQKPSTGCFKVDLQSADASNEYAGSNLVNIPLLWKRRYDKRFGNLLIHALSNASLTIKPFTDVRKKPSEIGINIELKSSGKIRYVTTRDNVAESGHGTIFGKILSEFDITVVKSGGTLSLEAEIEKFSVTEGLAYKADIGLKSV